MREDSITRGSSKKIYKSRARLNLRKYLFPHRVVNKWNDLPEWVACADSFVSFESRLDKFWKNQEQKFNYRAQITTSRSRRANGIEAAVLEP